ncbi:MAG TPA: FAD-dependent oxidoreductase [Pseudonocardia sp.]
MSRTDVDVVVVGRNAVAGAAAWHLAGDGREVLLLSRTGTGPPPTEVTVPARTGDPAVSVGLAAASLPVWREVEAETGVPLLSLIGGIDHGDPERTLAVADALDTHGIPYTWLTSDEAASRWPGMIFVGPVLHQQDRSGRVHAAQATRALAAAAVGRGALLAPGTNVGQVRVGGEDHVRVDTSEGPVRARRVLVLAGSAAPPEHSTPLTGLWASGERIVGFPPVGINPCVAQQHDWPVFVHHTGPASGWPGAVFGAPDPCGDVLVGFDGTGLERCPPAHRLREYVAGRLPGLRAGGVVPSPRALSATGHRSPAIAVDGPVVTGTGFDGRGTAFAPVLGRLLADLVDLPGAPELLARFGRDLLRERQLD